MFKTVFRYNLLSTLRVREVLFWSLAFPLLLSMLFFMAFGNMDTAEMIREPIKVAYVAPQVRNPLYNLQSILGGIPRGQDEAEKMFDLREVSEEEARKLVMDNEVDAALIDGQVPQLLLTKVEGRQVVVKQVLDQVEATKNTVFSLMRKNPLTNISEVQQQLSQADFTTAVSLGGGRMSMDIVYFMALLAMTCLGACSAGAVVIFGQQANRSSVGARLAASSANKWYRVGAASLATFLVQVAMSFIVFGFMTLVLKKDFGPYTGYILLVLTIGTLLGFLMGMAVACAVWGKENMVLGVTTGLYLFSSFLAGLMSDRVKRLVETSAPLVSRWNPGSMIVDSLYSLYYYQSIDYTYLGRMLLVCLLFAGVVVLTLRRRYHDSL